MDLSNTEATKQSNTKLMKQRTYWAILTSLARNCSVKKSDNTTECGLLHTFCKKGVILYQKSENDCILQQKLTFDQFISVECKNIQIASKSKFKIDQEISKSTKLQKRQLQQWEGEETSDLTFDLKDYKGWDQFEINAEKFGVKSTYDENLYTTPVPHISELTEDQVLRARMVEKELSGNSKDREEEEDEEAMFGAVLGSGRYENAKRSGSRKVQKKIEEKGRKHRKGSAGLKKKEKAHEGKEAPFFRKAEAAEIGPKTFRIFKNVVTPSVNSPVKVLPLEIKV